MVEADELADQRLAVEEGFQDEARFPTETLTKTDRGGTSVAEGAGTTVAASLQRMSAGDERAYASRLEGKSGYRLKVPHTVSPTQRGDVIVNGDRYEILAGFGGEERSTHTRFLIARHS